MTPKERLNKTLKFEEPDRPPHFEHTYELVEEAFALSYPSEDEMNASTGLGREKLFAQCAEVYARTVERFKWDAVLVWRPAMRNSAQYEFIPFLKRYLGPDIPVGSFIWGSAICIDTIKDYMQFSIDLFEDRGKLLKWAEEILISTLKHAERLIDSGCDMISINNDCAFNSGTFISPDDFAELTTSL